MNLEDLETKESKFTKLFMKVMKKFFVSLSIDHCCFVYEKK